MIDRLALYTGQGCDPYRNLAVEQHLLETVGEGCCILYLWQNRATVVVGRNQNAWRECRVDRLRADGVHLARRLSGGGAVFHDLGNLNFTFLVHSADYDVRRQLRVILDAARALGVDACASGRNDLVADGRKFSGNAFFHHGGRSCHHGTLLVDVDMGRLGDYLVPSKAKLAAKGVASVRSRVCNLADISPGVDVDVLAAELPRAFGRVYRLPVGHVSDEDLDLGAVAALERRYGSWEWNYGAQRPFSLACERRFDWGEVRVELQVEEGRVARAAVFTDAMDADAAPALEAALAGARLDSDELAAAVARAPFDGAGDVAGLLLELEL